MILGSFQNYKKSIFFEEFRKLPHSYDLIDTKAILEKELLNYKKDIFFSDDTHWSYLGEKVIVNNIKFE